MAARADDHSTRYLVLQDALARLRHELDLERARTDQLWSALRSVARLLEADEADLGPELRCWLDEARQLLEEP